MHFFLLIFEIQARFDGEKRQRMFEICSKEIQLLPLIYRVFFFLQFFTPKT